MAPVYVGILSVVPSLLTVVLALVTKEVVFSLLLGALSGSAIYCMYTGRTIIEAIKLVFIIMSKSVGQNIFMIIFGSILGALVQVITIAGGSQAYGKWAVGKLKTKRSAQISTALLGILLSIDDYFNCLTVGTVMKPIMDKHKVSRSKFAYILDSMAAPVCVIVPISSWAASIISCIDSVELNGMMIFMRTIPYNFYAILTIMFVFIVSSTKVGFGPMKVFEEKASKEEIICDNECTCGTDKGESQNRTKATVWDLILPLLILMVVSIFLMLETGGFFKGGVSIYSALGNTNSGLSITIGAISALLVAFCMFVPRKLLDFKEFMEGVNEGVKSLTPAFLILALAWTMSDVCGELLCTGEYISDLASYSHIYPNFIPAFVFLLSGFLAFSLGTSWGTFGILIPVVATVCEHLSPNITVVALAATLSGSVFGDHCSPISDTMILSSTGAGCDHMEHVSTQMPYACLVAACSFLGYVIVGLFGNLILSISVSALIMITAMIFLYKRAKCQVIV